MNQISFLVPYRQTDHVSRKLAARRAAILSAGLAMAAEHGLDAVQVAPLAARAGIAAGTVYRYFPAKADLIAALVDAHTEREAGAVRQAWASAPGCLSALAAAAATFAARVSRAPHLSETMLGERRFREAVTAEFSALVAQAVAGGHIPPIDPPMAASALVGAVVQGSGAGGGPRDPQAMALTLVALRALGVGDARARGLVLSQAIVAEPSQSSTAASAAVRDPPAPIASS